MDTVGGVLTLPATERRQQGWRAHLGDLVKLAEELIQHHHQLLGGAVAGQLRKAHDVSVEDAGGEAGQEGQSGQVEPEHPPALCPVTPASLRLHRDGREAPARKTR